MKPNIKILSILCSSLFFFASASFGQSKTYITDYQSKKQLERYNEILKNIDYETIVNPGMSFPLPGNNIEDRIKKMYDDASEKFMSQQLPTDPGKINPLMDKYFSEDENPLLETENLILVHYYYHLLGKLKLDGKKITEGLLFQDIKMSDFGSTLPFDVKLYATSQAIIATISKDKHSFNYWNRFQLALESGVRSPDDFKRKLSTTSLSFGGIDYHIKELDQYIYIRQLKEEVSYLESIISNYQQLSAIIRMIKKQSNLNKRS